MAEMLFSSYLGISASRDGTTAGLDPSSPQRGEGGPKGRMRGAARQMSSSLVAQMLAPFVARPLIASLCSALLPAGEKREQVATASLQRYETRLETT
ncbi:hypothetical protein E0H57_05860 [Rhizobium leguminosarum bv. viciae]|nr:hypothetical protein E0H32_29740 [Rhizobium leguminosarum bv. viciae]TCA10344.1 hypothetical protein E0H57_05860 [Rhizobium leguminosarum bv. viciae]